MHTTQLLTLLQIVDSAFPTGAFSHSNGLETYTQAGTVADIETLRAFLVTRLIHGMARGDLLLVKAAYGTSPPDPLSKHGEGETLHDLDQLASASKTPLESYEASTKIGRRMLSAVSALLTSPALVVYGDEIRAGRCAGHHAIVFGLACAAIDLPVEETLSAFAYNAINGQIAAAVKLLALGQTPAQALLHAMGTHISEAVAVTMGCTLDDYAAFTPALDARAMQHQYLFRRLFIS